MENIEMSETVGKKAKKAKINEKPAELASGDAVVDDAKRKMKMTVEQRDLAVRLASASIADAIGLYMRSDRHKHMSFADLEWMLLPALAFNQIKFAYARPQLKPKDGSAPVESDKTERLPPVAVAMITWATVSPEVAAKLDAQKKAGQLHRLAPVEWKTGKELRIIDALGQVNLINEMTKRVSS